MGLNKQAKVLTEKQLKSVLSFVERTRYPIRNRVIVLLSFHSLRAKEIADIELSMITDAEGSLSNVIALENKASKGKSGRIIPMSEVLRSALGQYLAIRGSQAGYLIQTERSDKFSANAIAVWFNHLYREMGFVGASSHSGRRTFITNASRKLSAVSGSLHDLMALSGHRQLSNLQKYIEQNPEAQSELVKVLFSGF